MHGEFIDERVVAGTVAVVGVPYDASSSYLRGPALAPARIRDALQAGSSNWSTECGVDLDAVGGWVDLGDLAIPNMPEALPLIGEHVGRLVAKGARVVSLGGDHAISFPLVRAHAARHHAVTILQVDAHPDLYDEYEGSRHSHACPFARIMEEGLAGRLVQVGIRTMTDHQRRQAERFGVEVIDMHDWHAGLRPDVTGHVYLSLDLDGLDPAFAPGVSHPEPGGLTTRDVLDLVRDFADVLMGADIVELNPLRDPAGLTAMVAAKFYKEIVGHMRRRTP